MIGHTRRAELADVPALVALSRRCYDEMDFDGFGYRLDDDVMGRSWILGTQGNILRGYVHCGDYGINGIMLCALPPATAYFVGSPKIAQEIIFHADPELKSISRTKIMMEMLDYGISDLRSIGIQSLYINSDVRYPAISNMLQRRGFKPMSFAHYLEV